MSAVSAELPRAKSDGRVAELEDVLNRTIYHPLAFRLARLLVPTGVTPNAVSIVSGTLVCLAAVFYTQVDWPAGALAGFACHLAWHVADGADGDLARLTGKASPLGEFIDGAADYLGHIFLYVLLSSMLDDGPVGGWAWALAAVSGASRIAQSNHSETQRRQYLWRVYGIGWLKTQPSADSRAFAAGNPLSRAAASVIRAYLGLAAWTAPYSASLDRVVEDAAADPARLAQVRRRIRDAAHGSLVLEKALGANWRTILLGLCMLLASPLWYFLWEAVVLNVVLVVSTLHHNRVERRLLAELG